MSMRQSILAVALRALRAVPLFLLALFATTGPLQAQGGAQLKDPDIAPFSNFYLTTGTMLVDVGKINAHFNTANGFFAISNDAYSVGGGFYVPLGSVLLGAEYHFADLGIESSPGGKTDQMTSSYAMLNVGYSFVSTWSFNVFATMGIGRGTNTLTFRNRSGGATVPAGVDPTFDEILLSPGLSSELNGVYYIVQPQLGVDYIMLRHTDSHMGLTLGFRIATAITPNRTTWKYQGRDVFGSPDAGPAGPMMRLQIGIGGFRLAGR